jgi:uncharacterized repeat protein (TIGR02543 family)
MKKTIVHVIGIAAIAVFVGLGCNDKGVEVKDGEVDGFLNSFTDTLTVNISPTGVGTVSRSPEQVKYPLGTAVTLTASADPGYAFTGWSGASESTDETITIIVDDHKKLAANFKESPFNVNDSAAWEKTIGMIKNGGNNKNYTINLSNDISIGDYRATFDSIKGITVTLQGGATISHLGDGSLLIIDDGQTVILKDLELKRGQVYIRKGGTFIMEGGTISGNDGSGVVDSGTFIMEGGTVSGNSGSGVFVRGGGTFTMNEGRISGNSTGVSVSSGIFTMTGGAIWGNTSGGGVYVEGNAIFSKTGGLINGYDGDSENGNVATSGSGHAVYAGGRWKNTSAVLDMDLYYNGITGVSSGAWDY